MKRLILTICFLFIGITSSNATVYSSISEERAEVIVKTIADETLNFLKKQQENDWNGQAVEDKFTDILNKYFNVNYIGKASLGIYWKKATDIQKKEYLEAFKKNIVKVYAVRFKEYSNQIIKVERTSIRGKRDITVFSSIISGNELQPALDVDWRVRVQKDGSYKIIDLNVAGISMLITQKNEYQTIIEKNGGNIDALINELKHIVENN